MTRIPTLPQKSGGIKLMLEIQVPPPPVSTPEKIAQYKRQEPVPGLSVEDKVKDCLDKIDSGHESHVEWITLRNLYKSLRAIRKPSDRAKDLMRLMEPCLAKYGYASSVDTDGDK